MLTIAVIGTFDTKGSEHAFIAECIRRSGHGALLIDVGTTDGETIATDVACRQLLVASAEQKNACSPIQHASDRGAAIGYMATHAPRLIRELYEQRKIDGIIGLGGTGGTSIVTAAMRGLPLGFPKVMVSTVASGDVSRYIDISDIVMFPSIVDVSGLNRISQGVFVRAAAAVVAMAEANANLVVGTDSKPLIVASMFGNTTRCVEHARKLLETAGYEVIVFHATGSGGRTMEGLIASGMVTGVLDVTTTEWADELVGGIMPGGPDRLKAAALNGVPAVVAPGCLDMVNFGERCSVPERFSHRRFYQHNPQITLMRTSPDECTQLGRLIADRLNLSTGPVKVLFPGHAISVISAPGQPFHDPVADQALLSSLQQWLRADIALQVVDCQINDERFAEQCVAELLNAIDAVASAKNSPPVLSQRM